MRWGWVWGGSVAATCGVVAVALFLGDLEKLSWVAGAGSFILAVPSLVAALWSQIGDATSRRPSDPADESVFSGRIRTQVPHAAHEDSPVAVELITPWMRLVKRLTYAFKGGGCGLLFSVGVLVLPSKFGLAPSPDLEVWLFCCSLCGGTPAFLMFILSTTSDGRDLLIADSAGLTVVDKRWIREGQRKMSFSVPWTLVRRVRVIAEPGGASYAVVVEFKQAPPDTPEGEQLAIVKERSQHVSAYNGHVVARLDLSSGSRKRTALLPRIRTALARFGGDVYGP